MKSFVVTVKGQVTLPKEIRDYLHIRAGDKIHFLKKGNNVVVKPAKANILDLRGTIKSKKIIKDFGKVRKKVMTAVARRIASEGK